MSTPRRDAQRPWLLRRGLTRAPYRADPTDRRAGDPARTGRAALGALGAAPCHHRPRGGRRRADPRPPLAARRLTVPRHSTARTERKGTGWATAGQGLAGRALRGAAIGVAAAPTGTVLTPIDDEIGDARIHRARAARLDASGSATLRVTGAACCVSVTRCAGSCAGAPCGRPRPGAACPRHAARPSTRQPPGERRRDRAARRRSLRTRDAVDRAQLQRLDLDRIEIVVIHARGRVTHAPERQPAMVEAPMTGAAPALSSPATRARCGPSGAAPTGGRPASAGSSAPASMRSCRPGARRARAGAARTAPALLRRAQRGDRLGWHRRPRELDGPVGSGHQARLPLPRPGRWCGPSNGSRPISGFGRRTRSSRSRTPPFPSSGP